MFNHYCLVCHDPDRFNMVLSDAKRIDSKISTIISKYNNIDIPREIEHEFVAEHNSVHITCGNCYKIHTNSLSMIEKSINDKLKKVSALIYSKEFDDSDYFQILQLLRGHYIRSYKYLERIHAKSAA